MAFFNKYPYTDFHELNADYLLAQLSAMVKTVEDLVIRVTTIEDDVTDLKQRVPVLETRMAGAERDIDALEAADRLIDGRLAALEGSDIMDAQLVESVGSVAHGVNTVTLNYTRCTYEHGQAGEGVAIQRNINAATDDTAGVMVPAQKKKLDTFTVDGSGNVIFSGTVSGNAPAGNSDYATKQYVDSIVISGGATVTFDNSPVTQWDTSSYATVTANNVKGMQYGNVREIRTGTISLTILQAVSSGGISVASGRMLAAYAGGTFGNYQRVIPCRRDRAGVFDIVFMLLDIGYVDPFTGLPEITIQSVSGQTLAAGDKVYLEDFAVYIARGE